MLHNSTRHLPVQNQRFTTMLFFKQWLVVFSIEQNIFTMFLVFFKKLKIFAKHNLGKNLDTYLNFLERQKLLEG